MTIDDIPVDEDEISDGALLVYEVLMSSPRFVTFMTNRIGNEDVVDIYGPPGLPDNWEIRRGLFFLSTGGPSDPDIPIAKESFDFYAYGNDAAEARAVFNRLRYLLHRRGVKRIEVNDKTYIYQYSQVMSGPQDRTDPEEGWNLVYSSFFIHYIETSVPEVL